MRHGMRAGANFVNAADNTDSRGLADCGSASAAADPAPGPGRGVYECRRHREWGARRRTAACGLRGGVSATCGSVLAGYVCGACRVGVLCFESVYIMY